MVEQVGIVPPWLGGDVPHIMENYLPVLPVPPVPPCMDTAHYDHGDPGTDGDHH